MMSIVGRFNQREWIGSVRRGGPCARPPLRVRGPTGDHHQGVYARLRRAKGRPYEFRGRATPSLHLTQRLAAGLARIVARAIGLRRILRMIAARPREGAAPALPSGG